MIHPRRLLLLPLISSVLVTHAQAADAAGKSAPAPTSSTVAPKEKSPPITAADLERFAPLYTDLASDPANKPELDFMIASKNRILGIPDRGEPAPAIIERFKKKFPAIEKTHPALRVAMAYLILNMDAWAIPGQKAVMTKLLVEGTNESPATHALRLAATAQWQCKLNEAGPFRLQHLGDLLPAQNKLLECIREMPEETIRNLPDETLLTLLNSLYNKVHERKKHPDQFAFEKTVCDRLEAMPTEAMRAPHRIFLGNYYTDKAWIERGTEFADKTTPEQFAAFEKHLRVAADHYRAAIEKNPALLSAYQGLLLISMASPEIAGGDETHWYQLCEKISPNDESSARLYIFASQLRWGKPESNLLNLIEKILVADRYDTAMPHLCIDAMDTLLKDTGDKTERKKLILLKSVLVVQIANRYLDDIRAGKRRVIGQNGFPLSDYHKFNAASVLSHYEEGIPFLPLLHPETNDAKANAKIDKQIASHVASQVKSKPFENLAWKLQREYLLPEGSDADVIQRRADLARINEFIKRAEALAKKDAGVATEFDLAGLMPTLIREKNFAEGKPVTLSVMGIHTFDGAPDWEFGKNFVKAKDLGPPSGIYATYREVFSPPFEITCKVRDVKLAPDAYFGVHAGRTATGTAGRSFVLNKKTGEWLILRGRTSDLREGKIAGGNLGALPDQLTLTLRVFAHGYKFSLNGKTLHEGRDDTFQPRQLSIGSLPLLPTTGSVIYEEPVVRKLKPEELTAAESEWMRDAES